MHLCFFVLFFRKLYWVCNNFSGILHLFTQIPPACVIAMETFGTRTQRYRVQGERFVPHGVFPVTPGRGWVSPVLVYWQRGCFSEQPPLLLLLYQHFQGPKLCSKSKTARVLSSPSLCSRLFLLLVGVLPLAAVWAGWAGKRQCSESGKTAEELLKWFRLCWCFHFLWPYGDSC